MHHNTRAMSKPVAFVIKGAINGIVDEYCLTKTLQNHLLVKSRFSPQPEEWTLVHSAASCNLRPRRTFAAWCLKIASADISNLRRVFAKGCIERYRVDSFGAAHRPPRCGFSSISRAANLIRAATVWPNFAALVSGPQSKLGFLRLIASRWGNKRPTS